MTTQIEKARREVVPIKNKIVNKEPLSWKEINEINERRTKHKEYLRQIEHAEAKKLLGEAIQLTELEQLQKWFREIEPMEFYSSIFKDYLDEPNEFNKGEYCAILCERTSQVVKDSKGQEKTLCKRYSITNGLNELDSLIHTSKNFCFMSPISYCGKHRRMNNARYYFAMVIEIDDLIRENDVPQGLRDLVYEIENEVLPRPTYIVHSGQGIHLYFVFKEPIPLYKSNQIIINQVRKKLIKKFWNFYITNLHKQKDIQYESLNQGFRVVGTRTKRGLLTDTNEVARAFIYANGEEVDFNYLASFTDYERGDQIKFKPKHTKEELKELYPEWYEKHFTPKGTKRQFPKINYWKNKPEMYEWYLKQIPTKASQGHRYYSLLVLASYALKCGVPKKRFEADCWSLLKTLDDMTDGESNHFTEDDVRGAIRCYDQKNLTALTIDRINEMTGFNIQKNKRNGFTREENLKIARSIQAVKCEITKTNWRQGGGQQPKRDEVIEWRLSNLDGTKYRCIKETGLSKHTVYKWWNAINEEI